MVAKLQLEPRSFFFFPLQLRQQRGDLSYMCYIQLQVTTSPECHRSRAKAERGRVDMSKVCLSKVVDAIRMAINVLDPPK